MRIFQNGMSREMTDEEINDFNSKNIEAEVIEPEVTLDDVVEALDILTNIVLGGE